MLRALQYRTASNHVTVSTGQSLPHPVELEGFTPIRAAYCPWVTCVVSIQNAETCAECRISFSARPISVEGLPIKKLPAGISFIPKPSWSAYFALATGLVSQSDLRAMALMVVAATIAIESLYRGDVWSGVVASRV